MTLELKDAIYLIVYIVSVAGVFLAFRNELKNLKDAQAQDKDVIWQKGGRLNLVDHKSCREYRDALWTSMRQKEKALEMLLAELKEIKENQIITMTYMGIKKLEKNNPDNV